MFGTKGVNTEEKKWSGSKYISYGNQLLKIYDIETKTATSGSKQLILYMESPEITEPNFEAEAGHTGRVGKVAFPGVYVILKGDKAVKALESFNRDIGIIADKMGVRAELDAISVDAQDPEAAFEEYTEKIKSVLIGKWLYWAIAGENYWKVDGPNFKEGWKLKVRRYKFVASKSEGMDHLGPFDTNIEYNVKVNPKPEFDSNTVSQNGQSIDHSKEFFSQL